MDLRLLENVVLYMDNGLRMRDRDAMATVEGM